MSDPRPYKGCLCTPDNPCKSCPLAHPCYCGATEGQRCGRPSGHKGPFVMTHEDRLLRSDVAAIERDPAEVEARLLAHREDGPDAIAAWVRALNGLARNIELWQGRIDPAVIERYIALARTGEPPVERPVQLRLDLS